MEEETGIKSTEDLREDLECVECLKIPSDIPIYQCKKGHIYCKDCQPNIRQCPICREFVRGDTRSLMTEKILSK